MKKTNKAIEAYLEYWNNFLTLSAFADSKGISETEALLLIKRGRKQFNAGKN